MARAIGFERSSFFKIDGDRFTYRPSGPYPEVIRQYRAPTQQPTPRKQASDIKTFVTIFQCEDIESNIDALWLQGMVEKFLREDDVFCIEFLRTILIIGFPGRIQVTAELSALLQS